MNINMVMRARWKQEDSKRRRKNIKAVGAAVLHFASGKNARSSIFLVLNSNLPAHSTRGTSAGMKENGTTAIYFLFFSLGHKRSSFWKLEQPRKLSIKRLNTCSGPSESELTVWGIITNSRVLKRALIPKRLAENNQFMCAITKCIHNEIKLRAVFLPLLYFFGA